MSLESRERIEKVYSATSENVVRLQLDQSHQDAAPAASQGKLQYRLEPHEIDQLVLQHPEGTRVTELAQTWKIRRQMLYDHLNQRGVTHRANEH